VNHFPLKDLVNDDLSLFDLSSAAIGMPSRASLAFHHASELSAVNELN